MLSRWVASTTLFAVLSATLVVGVAAPVYSGTGNPVGLLTDFSSVSFAYGYDPYGVPILTASSGGNGVPQNPFLFAGGIQDRATGWVKYGARWCSPVTGRWTQQDTLDAPLDPVNGNRYAYAGNDPVNVQDPSGFGPACDTNTRITAGAAAFTGVAAAAAVISAPTVIGGVTVGTIAAGSAVFTGLFGGITYIECQLDL